MGGGGGDGGREEIWGLVSRRCLPTAGFEEKEEQEWNHTEAGQLTSLVLYHC